MNAEKQQQKTNIGLLLLRSTLGILILFHGIANLSSNYIFIKELLEGYHIPGFFAYGVFVGEIVAPILLIIGYKVRLNSVIIAFNFFIAIILAHNADIFSLSQSGGWALELQGLYLFGSIALYFTGGGNYALSTNSKQNQ